MLVCDPFRMTGREELVKEVIGLANARVTGPRHILFGVNPGAVDGNKIVGISEAGMSDLKKAHRHISELIEPVVSLAFMFDMIGGKLVGALEIDDCDAGPFAVGQDYSRELALGKAWIREGHDLREVDTSSLVEMDGPEEAEVAEEPEVIEPEEIPVIDVGFNDDPDKSVIEFPIPDTSNPPFGNQMLDAVDDKNLKQTLRDAVSTATTRILSLAKKNQGDSDPNSSTDVVRAAEDICTDADNHYFYEERAIHLDLVACNKGDQAIGDVEIELGFPVIDGLEVVDRVHVNPFDQRAKAKLKKSDYPKVESRDQGIFVQSRIGKLDPNSPIPALRSALRLAVAPSMARRKIAVLYTLRRNGQEIGDGRLKIQFGEVAS